MREEVWYCANGGSLTFADVPDDQMQHDVRVCDSPLWPMDMVRVRLRGREGDRDVAPEGAEDTRCEDQEE